MVMNGLDEKHRKVILIFLVSCLVITYVLNIVNYSNFHAIQINEYGAKAAEIGIWLIFFFIYGVLFYLIGVFMPEKRRILKKICKIYGTTSIIVGVLTGIITVAQLLF